MVHCIEKKNTISVDSRVPSSVSFSLLTTDQMFSDDLLDTGGCRDERETGVIALQAAFKAVEFLHWV